MPRKLAPTLQRALAWAGAIAVLAGVFVLYTQPDLRVALAEQIWACLP